MEERIPRSYPSAGASGPHPAGPLRLGSRVRSPFADPKTDFVFKRIVGTEEHKDLLGALLEALLQLDEAHGIEELTFLPPEQVPVVEGQKSPSST